MAEATRSGDRDASCKTDFRGNRIKKRLGVDIAAEIARLSDVDQQRSLAQEALGGATVRKIRQHVAELKPEARSKKPKRRTSTNKSENRSPKGFRRDPVSRE